MTTYYDLANCIIVNDLADVPVGATYRTVPDLAGDVRYYIDPVQ